MNTPCRSIRRPCLILAIVLVVSPRAATRGAPLPQPNRDARIDRVEQWMGAVMRHEPGEADDAARLVGSWTATQVRTLWIDANVVVQIMRNPKGVRFTVRAEGQTRAVPIVYTPKQLRRLRALACAAAGRAIDLVCADLIGELDEDLRRLATRSSLTLRADDNYILRRGALLHADIEMLLPRVSEPLPGATQPAVAMGPQRVHMNTSDGLALEITQVPTHWEIARMLLDNVRPYGVKPFVPGRDEMVRSWYHATAAWMQQREDYDTLHLDHARQIFPADPDILFLSGCLRELYAAPPVQSAMKEAPHPNGFAFDIHSDRAELRQAETFFRGAVAGRPTYPEAHLRLGRVLALLERPAEAANELRQALASTDDSLLQYYGQLFLGAAEEALGQFDASRAAYDAAAALYPTAQSPRMALSALARRRGDRGGALRALQQIFDLPPFEADRDDPWWSYHVAQARNADELLEALRKPFQKGAE